MTKSNGIMNIHGLDVIVVKDRKNGCEECVFQGFCDMAANHTEEVCGEEQIGYNFHFEKPNQ